MFASMEYPPPEGHSLEINAETSVDACGSDLWQKIRDRWRARRAETESKTHQIETWRDEGRRGDGRHELGAEGICQGRQQEHGREAPQRRPQDALRALPASAGSQKRSLHVLDDQTRGARVTRNRKSNCAPTLNRRRPRARVAASVLQGLAAFTGLLQALSERGQHSGDDLEPEGGFRFGTSLQAGQSVRPQL